MEDALDRKPEQIIKELRGEINRLETELGQYRMVMKTYLGPWIHGARQAITLASARVPQLGGPSYHDQNDYLSTMPGRGA